MANAECAQKQANLAIVTTCFQTCNNWCVSACVGITLLRNHACSRVSCDCMCAFMLLTVSSLYVSERHVFALIVQVVNKFEISC